MGNHRSKIATTFLLAAWFSQAAAQQPPAKPGKVWSKEPDSVLGVKLGLPLAESNLPECAFNLPPDGPICLKQVGGGHPSTPAKFYLFGTPFSYASFPVTLTDDGRVYSVSVELSRDNFDDFAGALVARYGPPTNQFITKAQNSFGASLSGRLMAWTGKRVNINAIERISSDRSVVTFTDRAIEAAQTKSRLESSKSAAGKL